ncbi:cytochrome b [Massilia forsythiae]|uniref:Cytochrome b n=1 Tax=Massilia forsythiae TaxID=2728020 RepID=A0A7Z2VUU1_9BURK|nr:cytochrome b/b6 domain-containing protein [Massilia forsythiae]QJD99376.1 cytochrome b [Massilia forsythiae]
MSQRRHFNLLARALHWSMAVAILAMLFIGAGMVASLRYREQLIDLHRPLGLAILLLAIVRLANRLRHAPPPLPADLPRLQKLAATLSHWLLYALMLAMPLIGWAMLSAGAYPVVLFDGVNLPPILPHSPALYGVLRPLHGVLAYLLFLVILGHLGAALFHAWVRRDGVFEQMAKGE